MVIFWDIDGTLMYCGADGTYALNETFKELYDIEDAFHKVGIGHAMDSAILEKIMTKFDIPESDITRIKNIYIEKLKIILKQDQNKRVLPGVRELLYFCQREGHINSLLTSNMKIGAEAKLKSVNLDGHFIGGGFGDNKGEKWNTAVSALKEIECETGSEVRSKKVIIIGDSVYDIKTAKKCNYNMISVATGWTGKEDLIEADPDIIFDDLSDTEAVMDVIRRMDRGE